MANLRRSGGFVCPKCGCRHACLPSVPPAAPSLAGGTHQPRRLGYGRAGLVRRDEGDFLPHGRMMIHDPLIGQTGGSALQLRKSARG